MHLRGGGLEGLEQTMLECAPGTCIARVTGGAEEVLFVLAGQGELRLGPGPGDRYALEPETGVNLGPDQEYELRAKGSDPMRTVCVRIHAPELTGEGCDTAERTLIRRLADQECQQATTDRSYRIVADPSTGLRSATHFVGYVPTERAPDHFHTYDEVIYVLDGEGAFHAGGEDTALTAGSTIEVPARTVHCLENTGQDVLRLVAVFRPAGSPAAAYYPDGTPAYAGTPQLMTPDP